MESAGENMSWSSPMPGVRMYTYHGFLTSSIEVQLRIWVKQTTWSLGGLATQLICGATSGKLLKWGFVPTFISGIIPGLLPDREMTIKWNMSNHFVKCRGLHKCKKLPFYWTMNSKVRILSCSSLYSTPILWCLGVEAPFGGAGLDELENCWLTVCGSLEQGILPHLGWLTAAHTFPSPLPLTVPCFSHFGNLFSSRESIKATLLVVTFPQRLI